MPIPVITVAQMREWEKATWASGQTEPAVIRQAGAAVAQQAARMTRPGELALVLAGRGHNGDDARCAAGELADRRTQVVAVSDPAVTAAGLPALLAQHPALLIDGLFGIGLNRPLSAAWLSFIEQLNLTGLPILSVDVPSGLNADTGLPLEDAVRATVTLTFGAVKQGLLRPSAWPFVGRLEVAPEIGLIPYPFTTEVSYTVAADFAGFPPPRPPGGHKGTFGHLAILAGSPGYHGAAVLAARGAQRAQPGLITLLTAPEVYTPVAEQMQAVMVRAWTPDLALPDSCTALLVGPGLAAPTVPGFVKEFVRQSWQTSPLVMIADASALDWLPAGACASGVLRVITPHPGEAARMLQVATSDVQLDRPRSLRELSRRFGHCCVALKGHQTLTGCAREGLFVNGSGNPRLAQGGSGDLLAGYVGGLLAQPALQREPTKTLRYAVWQHGAAADALDTARRNWTIEDLAEVLGNVGG
jgi:NAD(P)H-hydrate epimerase